MYLALIPNPGDGLYIAYRLRGAWHDWESTKVGWLRSRCQIRTSNQLLLRKCVLPLSGVTDTPVGQIKGHWTFTVAMPRGPFHKVGSQQKNHNFKFHGELICGSCLRPAWVVVLVENLFSVLIENWFYGSALRFPWIWALISISIKGNASIYLRG